MSNYGIQLRKLQLEGANKENATIDFNIGLNVIAGASDTGKSFAFECINYILGATDIPKLPQEALGYTSVLLEFLDKKSNQIITLKRSLLESKKSDIYYIYSEISKISNATYEILSVSSNAANNLSVKLLSICNCPYRNVLKKSSNGETEAFTFRKFVHLTMLNEARIVQNNSPIYLGDTNRDQRSTKETASFFTLLTGIDYEKYKKTDSVEIKKAHLKGAIDELTIICSDLQKEISSADINNGSKQLQENQVIIDELQNTLKIQREITETLETRHKEGIFALNTAIRDKSRILDNLSKFKLLKKNYQSDVSRLDFIEQAHNYTNQMADVRCPICHAEMKAPVTHSEVYYVAIQKEKEKLNMHLVDLQSTINDLETELEFANQRILQEEKKVRGFESELEKQAEDISLILIKHEQCLKVRDQLLAIENNRRKLYETKQRIQELNDRLNNTKNTSEKVSLKKPSEELLDEFCEIVENLLESWKFIAGDNNSVVFNDKDNDIIVSGKEKATYGKGARAIINSAFIIAIMDYCSSHGLSHPGFVILDSPLTTYKERDRQANLKNEDVANSVKAQFFYNLSRVCKHKQIIVFDNEIPPKDISNITYHHFTGNKEIRRTGFIPQSV